VSRFVQPDPVVPEPGDPQSWNRYSFVRNNPFNRVDPTGSLDIGAEIGGRLVEFLGGNRTAGEFFGSLGSSLVPGPGELADLGVLFSLDHRVGPGVRLAATGSLALSVVTGGASPNVGGVVRQADEIAEAGAAGVRAIAKGSAKTAGAVAEGAGAARGVPSRAPDFVVSPGGTAYPVPTGATGPVPVINEAGKRTGTGFTGGKGGANQQVDTLRIMDSTAPRGQSPGYPTGYIKYENAAGQGVNPYTGRTGSRAETHFPLDLEP